MKYDVAMTHEANQIATKHLLRHYQHGKRQEDVCFALWRSSTGLNRKAAIVYEVILPKEGERHLTGNASFSHEYVGRAIVEARRQNAGLAFMHSHPKSGWQDLSHLDEMAERIVLAPPARATDRPLVGMTVGSDGYWSARFWERGNGKPHCRWCEKVRLVGPQSYKLQFNDNIVQPMPRLEALKRTYDSWGTSVQNNISRMHVGIVGLGSVGCIVAETMARIGVRQITLFDPDRVEEHNLDRLLYGSVKDIGKLKVELAKVRMELSATAKEPEINAISKSIKDRDAFNKILDCDIILSCVDRPVARDILNYVANAHLIPVIDCGVAIRKDQKRDTLEGAHWRAHIITPYHQCLRCNSQYNTGMVSAELDGSLDNPSYVSALPDEDMPGNQNVFPFSLGVAALAVNLMMRYLIGQEWWPAAQQQDYQFQTGRIIVTNEECLDQCAFLAVEQWVTLPILRTSSDRGRNDATAGIDRMLAKSPIELDKLKQELRNGEHKNSSPGYLTARVESGIKADVGAALSIGMIETTTDSMAVHYTSLDAVISMLKAAQDDRGYLRN